jgi:hypothetical protein
VQKSFPWLLVPKDGDQAAQGMVITLERVINQRQVFDLIERGDPSDQGLQQMTPTEQVVHNLPIPYLTMVSAFHGLPTGRLAHGLPFAA